MPPSLAALRAFALIDREIIPDERDPAITTDTIRLHRLVRDVATALLLLAQSGIIRGCTASESRATIASRLNSRFRRLMGMEGISPREAFL